MKKLYALLFLLLSMVNVLCFEGAQNAGVAPMVGAFVDGIAHVVNQGRIADATAVVVGGVIQGIGQIQVDPVAAQALGDQIEAGIGHVAAPIARGITGPALHAIGDALRGDDLQHFAGGLGHAAQVGLEGLGGGVEQGLGAVGQNVGNGLGVFGQNVGDGLGAFGEGVADGMGDFGDRFGEGIGEMGEGLAGGVEDFIVHMGDHVGEGLEEIIRPDGPLRNGAYEMFEHLFYNHFRKVVITSVVGTGAVVFAIYGIPFALRRIESMLNTPKLIIESSKKSLLERIKGVFSAKPQPVVLVFAAKIEKRLNKILKSVRNIHKRIVKDGNKNVTYRNLMLYGAPGTGKTAFARELARKSGMAWAMMSGSSFAKFKGGEGIEALDKLFAWADRERGLLIFIDEADSFLGKREKMDPNSMDYKILTNFLNYTGIPSKKFMLVFATNHKSNLDSAMYERIHDYVHVPLPTYEERVRILELYKKKVLMSIKENGKAFVESVTEHLDNQKIAEIATKTDGFAGRGLEALINAILVGAAVSDHGLVSVEVIDEAVEEAVEKFNEFNE